MMAKYEYNPRFGSENHTFVVPYELTFDVVNSTQWMQKNWAHSFTLSLIYIVGIFGGQRVRFFILKFTKNTTGKVETFLW
jgi:hypothetical protein